MYAGRITLLMGRISVPVPVMVLLVIASIAQAGPDPAELSGETQNVADPEEHPYADPARGRSGHPFSGAKVNEARLYDFYARQADYYMAHPEKLDGASPLPAYPGLDAGEHGHWGKHNQNRYSDDRVNRIAYGGLQLRHVSGEPRVHNGGNYFAVLRLGEHRRLSAVFSWTAFGITGVWSEEQATLHVDGHRWGLARPATLRKGKPLWTHAEDSVKPHWQVIDGGGKTRPVPEKQRRYYGVYRHGRRSIFHYRLAGVRILDAPWAFSSGNVDVLTRTIRLEPTDGTGAGGLELTVMPAGGQRSGFERMVKLRAPEATRPHVKLVREDDGRVALRVESLEQARRLRLSIWAGPPDQQDAARAAIEANDGSIADPAKLIEERSVKWTEELTFEGKRGTGNGPLAIDTIPVPLENPYDSPMMLTGIDFLPNGDAAVCTVLGDVWIVSGLDEKLQRVTWRRYAAGLYQPFGLDVVDGTIHVATAPYVLALRDRNDDGECDYREVVTHDVNLLPKRFIRGSPPQHDTRFGLETDARGNFIFGAGSGVYKYLRKYDRTERIASGLRNPMGLERLPDGQLAVGPQEGPWTPASMFSIIQYGDDYGSGGPGDDGFNLPTAFIPRGVDNSTGGFVGIPQGRWGPLGGTILGLSYGYGTPYLILRDRTADPRTQAATVPVDGAFRSGVVRGQFRPQDGHMYVVGTEGWGNYALDDGCLHRLRYTGKPLRRPVGFRVHRNGIRIDLPERLDADTAENPSNYLVQMWNYEYAERYGSPEFSVRAPEKLGHDVLNVRSSHLLDGGRRVFLEIPKLRPSSVVHVRMHLRTAKKANGGSDNFRASLFPTVRSTGERFTPPDEQLAQPVKEKPERLRPRIRNAESKSGDSQSKKLSKADRVLEIEAIEGLKYNKTTLRAKAGELLAIKLVNTDPSMPHNLVVVEPGAYRKVGKAGMKMLNDPNAAEKHYVPSLEEVIAHTRVTGPEQTAVVLFQVPEEPGRYPYLCTFPGHWRSMRGTLIVSGR